jgi:hypothetical protein
MRSRIRQVGDWWERTRRRWRWLDALSRFGHRQLPSLGLHPLAPSPIQSPGGSPACPPLAVPPVRRHRRRARRGDRGKAAVAVCLATLVLTLAMGQRFYRQPELQVDTVAPETIVAPRDATVEDTETTEANRAAARTGAKPVLVPNPEQNDQIRDRLTVLLDQANALWEQAGPLPILPTDRLSTAAQTYLRQAPDEQWTIIQDVAALSADTPTLPPLPDLSQLRQQGNAFRQLLPRQQQAVRELVTYQQGRSSQARRAFAQQIEMMRSRYRAAREDLTSLAQAEGQILPDDPSFLDLSAEEWLTTQQGLRRALQRMLLQGIAEGVPPDILAEASKFQVRGDVPAAAENFSVAALMAVLEVNLEPDPERTLQKAEDAAEEVAPAIVSIQAGQPIVRAGEAIDRNAFVLLDEFNLSQRRLNLWGLTAFGMLAVLGIGLFPLGRTHRAPLPAPPGSWPGDVYCPLRLGVECAGDCGLQLARHWAADGQLLWGHSGDYGGRVTGHPATDRDPRGHRGLTGQRYRSFGQQHDCSPAAIAGGVSPAGTGGRINSRAELSGLDLGAEPV